MKPQVGIIMGSDSDAPIMHEAGKVLDQFGIGYEIGVYSAHRSPHRTVEYVRSAKERGLKIIIAGAGMGFVGLLACVIPGSVVPPMLAFAVGSFIYALGQSFVNPTISALVMERAPRHRLGSAMATYSIGFQFATGTSSVLWGAIITGLGFTWLFVVAAGFQVLAALLSRVLLAPRD